ncbi:MAG: PAS domain S-box protein [Candidatus Cloacimonetes bacterium]|nr:PAS domain S-box protein [Candidatus Cloacimonadota bacterium]
MDRIRVLLVEDDIIDQMAFKRLVKSKDLPYDYQIADSVAKAIDLLKNNSYDIVITDFNLGDGTAFDIFDSIIDTPFIFSTGAGDEEVAVKAMQAGAFHYQIKDPGRNYLTVLPTTIIKAIKLKNIEKEQLKAEKALRESEERYRTLQSNIPVGIYRSTHDGTFVSANPAMVKMLGYSSEKELLSIPVVNIYAFSDQRKDFVQEIDKYNTISDYEIQLKRKDGTIFWVTTNAKAVKDDNGEKIHFDGMIEDITERKEAQIKLQESEEWNRAILEAVPDTIFVLDKEGTFISYKADYESRLPVQPDRIVGKKIAELFPEALSKPAMKNLSITLKTGIVQKFEYELTFPEKDENKMFEARMSLSAKDQVLMLVRDITERKKAEEKINSLYNALLDELEMASSVQQYLLPPWLSIEGDMIFSSTYKPSSKIGGDLFDIIPISDSRYIVYVGDISGHGVQAALMMTAVKSIVNMIIENEKSNLQPYYIIDRMNKILTKELFKNNYITIMLCLVDLEKSEIHYFNAGHPPLIEFDVTTGKTNIRKEKGSIPVGWKAKYKYEQEDEDVVKFDENKIYLLYTDGIFECENQDKEQLGINGFTDFIEKYTDAQNCLTLPHKFKQKLTDLQYDISMDDFTLLAFQKNCLNQKKQFRKIFKITSLLQNTGPIGTECEQIVMKYFDDNKYAAKVELVVNEFLNNIMEHGLQLKKDTLIAFQIAVSDIVTLTFWDKGLEWSIPEKKEGKDAFASEDKFRGLGMQIIYSLVSEISRNRYDEINETVLIFKPEE